jgi:hypothetical protein
VNQLFPASGNQLFPASSESRLFPAFRGHLLPASDIRLPVSEDPRHETSQKQPLYLKISEPSRLSSRPGANRSRSYSSRSFSQQMNSGTRLRQSGS